MISYLYELTCAFPANPWSEVEDVMLDDGVLRDDDSVPCAGKVHSLGPEACFCGV